MKKDKIKQFEKISILAILFLSSITIPSVLKLSRSSNFTNTLNTKSSVSEEVSFDYVTIPDENGFEIAPSVDNSYFMIELDADIEYAIVLLQNKSFDEGPNPLEIGELSVHLFTTDQIIDNNEDGIADEAPDFDLDLVQEPSIHEEKFTQFVSVYIETKQTYAIYIQKYENVAIHAYLFLQESPGCFLAEGDFVLDEASVPADMSYTIEEKSLIYHVPGYKFRLRSQKGYNPDDDFNPSHISPHNFERSTQTFFVEDGRIDGYLRVDLPWYVGFNQTNDYSTAIAMTWYHHTMKDVNLKKEPNQSTINFTVEYYVTGLGSNMLWDNTIQHIYLFDYLEPGHVKIKHNQIFTFDNFSIYLDNLGKYANGFVQLNKFLPYYWKTVGDEQIDLSPIAEDYSGWYSLADFNFSSMVYSDSYDLYFNNGTQRTESCKTWVSLESGGGDFNYTWWYVRMPFVRDFPMNDSLGNVSKMFYDPEVNYYFLPYWLREKPDKTVFIMPVSFVILIGCIVYLRRRKST